MHVRVLGDLEIALDGARVDLGGPKPRALVGLLVAADGRPVPVEHLVDQVWGDAPPPRVEASLQSYVARLRKALDPGRAVLRTHTGGYSLDLSAAEVDARRFTDGVRDARSAATADPRLAVRLLEEALARWGGEAYAGLACPALRAEATRLEELRLAAVEELWELRLGVGEHRDAVADLERLVRAHPLRERSWSLLARALYAAARQGDALAALRRCREHLADELGVDPGQELRRLEEAILRQDPSLSAVSAPLPPAAPADPSVPTEPAAAAGHRLVGRSEQVVLAAAALDDAARGRGRLVLVTGDPGIGKTRLAEAVAALAAERGFRTGAGSWEEDGSPPLWGWRRAVAEAFGAADVLGPAGSRPLDAASESYRLAEALAAAVAAGPPVLLVLDDLHWADADSLRLLRRFATDAARLPVALVVALRTADAETARPVSEVLAALARLEPVRLELAGFDARAVAAYVEQRAGVEVTSEVAAALVERTDGNPFYVTELVRLLAAEGVLGRPGAPAWRRVPRGVLDVVRQRLTQLPEATVAVLAAGAVAGRSFDTPVAADALGLRAEEVEAALEPALALGVVEERGPARYRFTHALARDAVYETLPAPRRARLHGAVAAATEEHRAGRVADHAAELAEHYRLAGPAYARSAWTLARRAAADSAAGSAHEEALRLYALARDLQHHDELVTDRERREVALGLARELRRVGRPLEAWPLLAEVAEAVLAEGDVRRATEVLLEVTDGAIWGWRERAEVREDAMALWSTLAEALGDDPANGVLRARAEAALAVELLYQPGSEERSGRLVDTALQRVRRTGSHADAVDVLQLASLALSRAHLVPRRLAVAEELVERTARADDEVQLALALVKRGATYGELGRFDDAASDLTRAAGLAERHHLTQVLVIARWALNLLRLAAGDLATAEAVAGDLERLMDTLSMPGVGIGAAQVAGCRIAAGRLGELEPVLRWGAEHRPRELRDLHALALLEAGRGDEARRMLGRWSEQPALLEDYLWITFTVVRAWVWLRIGDAEAVRALRQRLEPHADLLATGGMSGPFLGSVAHTVGLLAAADGDLAAARHHLEAALATHERLGLAPWVPLSRAALASLPDGSGGGRAVDPEGVAAERPA